MKFKNIFAFIILSVMIVGILAGCGGTPVILSTGDKAPWNNGFGYEKIEYAVSRKDCTQPVGENDYTVIGEGSYVTEIIQPKTIAEFAEVFPLEQLNISPASVGYSVLRTSLTLTYNAKSAHNRKTEKRASHLLFYSSDLLPVYLTKTANFETDPALCYSVAVDYINGTNSGMLGDKPYSVETPKNKVYDSELMYYVVRAMSTLAPGASGSLSVHSALDSADRDKPVVFPIAFSTQANLGYLPVDSDDNFIKNCVRPLPERTSDGAYKLNCMATTIKINETQQGSSALLHYTSETFNLLGEKITGVLAAIYTNEIDAFTLKPLFVNQYIISGYSIQK